MKQITATLQQAILDNNSTRMFVKAIIDPSRTFFDKLLSDYPFDAEDYSVVTNTPVGQCMIYAPSMGKVYTFINDESTHTIVAMEQGSATQHDLSITISTTTKPSVIDMGNGTARVYYWDGALKYSVVDLSTYGVSGTITITVGGLPSRWTITSASPNVIDKNHIVLCYLTSKGGIGLAYKDGSSWFHWNQRFMSPAALTATPWTIYTAATIFNDLLYVYSTDIDTGEVRAVEFNPYTSVWSDIFIALPADISRFCVTNAIQANGFVHLAGQFHRTEDLANAKVYSLVLRSSNGKNFSWDRFTLLSSLGYQFQIDTDNENKLVYASDRNSIGVADMSYFFTPIPTHRVTLEPPDDIISFDTSQDSATLIIASANEEFIDEPAIEKGSRVTVYLGYQTAASSFIEYEKYGTFIIDSRKVIFRNGTRGLGLNLVSEGLWKTSQIAFPFYAEMLSKTSMLDDCEEQDKMYVVACYSGDYVDYLTIDFWNNEDWDGDEVVTGVEANWCSQPASEITVHTNSNGATDQRMCKTVTLTEHPYLTNYPVVTGTVTMRLYGWEHTAESSRANSTFTLYAVTAPTDDLTDKTVTTGVLESSYQKFPQEYPDTESGSYPIEFSFTGITEGHYLLYVGLTCSNSNTGTSTSYLERIEVEGVRFAYSQLTSQSAWTLDKPSGETRDFLKSPDTGLQNLMFTTKPYSAFNFNIAAEFHYHAGTDPLSPGTTAWGVVGIAKDGFDFFEARYHKQRSRIELLVVRNGESTVLATYNPSTTAYDIMLDHRNGMFRVWYRSTGNIWIGPVITHHYDEVTYGEMSTSDTGIMHTGIIGAVYPPGFIAASYSPAYSDGICMTTDQPISVLDGFPNSGEVVINDLRFSYTNKTTNTTSSTVRYGPHQLRQVTNIGTWREGGVTFEGVGIETALYSPSRSTLEAKDLLIGQSNHHNWKITMSDWTVEHSTRGQPDYLRDRSRHQSDSAVNEKYYGASTADKTYINHGLMGVELVKGESSYHPQGALVSIYSTDKIWVKKVVSTQIDHDATVEDMLTYLSHVASIDAEFPGNWVSDSVSIGTSPTQLAYGKELFPGGCDIRFDIPALEDSGDFIAIYPNNLYLTDTTDKIDFGFRNSTSTPGLLEPYIVPKTGTTDPQYITTSVSALVGHSIRILIHDDFVSMYADDQTLVTFAIGAENLEWPDEQLEMYIYSDSSRTVTNVKISELFDWREAIYIESEMSASSAIGSVIQERPIEIYPTRDGNLIFSYRFERDTVSYSAAESFRVLHSHTATRQNSDNAGSDALVYYADVAFQSNEEYARQDGFNTRVFRLSQLTTGAKVAARLLLEKALEKQRTHTVDMRPDARLEIGDKINFQYIVAGTNREVSFSGIVENINVALREGQYAMTVLAREVSNYGATKVNCYVIGD